MKKTNPKKKPITQADADRAWQDGVTKGVTNAMAIFLTVIMDKYDGEKYIADLWKEINKLSEEVKEKRVSVADLRRTLADEYGVYV
jgi:hypothetical protein